MGQWRAHVGVGAAQRRRAAAREQVDQAAEVALQGVLDGPPADRLEIGRSRRTRSTGGSVVVAAAGGLQMKRYLVGWMCCTLK